MKTINTDNPVVSRIQDIGDLFYAGLLWFVFSVPVVTAGAASAALYYTVVKVIRHKRGTVWQQFWHSFRDNLPHGIVFTLIYGAMIVLSAVFFGSFRDGALAQNQGYMLGGSMALIFLAMTLPYIFPVISRFGGGILKQFQITVFVSVGHIPTTFLLAALTAGVFALVWFVPFCLVVVPGPFTLLCSYLVEKAFRRHMKGAGGKNVGRDGGEDPPWYLE